ncbi:MAG: aspartate/glutamate racemase family protein [Pyrinomonadaceae bacterium]|nr:aspartate/glutamate racemase family protein [Pyrinomonadaceae bacterium]
MQTKLGILDWGIGGVSVYKQVKKRLGEVRTVYFSDTGAVPYGKMSRRELVERLNAVLDFLRSRGVTHLLVGCNAASTAIPDLRREDMKIEGVIESAVRATARLNPAKLAVIGGRRTILSGIYRRQFAARGIEIEQRVAQPLSGLIESGDTSSEILRREARKILTPVRSASHILLACTHYPAITGVLQEFVSPDTRFVDPAGALVEKISDWELEKNGADVFYTTGGAAAMKIAAFSAFGVKIPRVEKVTL